LNLDIRKYISHLIYKGRLLVVGKFVKWNKINS